MFSFSVDKIRLIPPLRAWMYWYLKKIPVKVAFFNLFYPYVVLKAIFKSKLATIWHIFGFFSYANMWNRQLLISKSFVIELLFVLFPSNGRKSFKNLIEVSLFYRIPDTITWENKIKNWCRETITIRYNNHNLQCDLFAKKWKTVWL